MKALEEAAVEAGVSVDTLMERAGAAVASQATQILANRRGAKVLVLVGPGNNGGDGLVAARHLHIWGARVEIYLCSKRKLSDPKLSQAANQGIAIIDGEDDRDFAQLQRSLSTNPFIIDAILGTGIARQITGRVKMILELVAATRKEHPTPLLAIDLPTGLNAETGAVDPACLKAEITVALGHSKVGHYMFPGAAVTGKLQIVDIGIPPGLDSDIELEEITPDLVLSQLPKRPLDSHKGTFGRLLVVAGSQKYVGAAILACNGAYRVGTGLVTLASPASIGAICAPAMVETTHLSLPEPTTKDAPQRSASIVREALNNYDALLVGCGLGQDQNIESFIQALFLNDPTLKTPMILDADALNILAKKPMWWNQIGDSTVLTPHPGEMARLINDSSTQVQTSRLNTVKEASRKWRKVVTLKGAFTIVGSPLGITRLSPFANPALASAGTGDVLAGAIGGLLAQGLSPMDAASCGVYLHGAAAAELRKELGDAGVVASDLLMKIPVAMSGIKKH